MRSIVAPASDAVAVDAPVEIPWAAMSRRWRTAAVGGVVAALMTLGTVPAAYAEDPPDTAEVDVDFSWFVNTFRSAFGTDSENDAGPIEADSGASAIAPAAGDDGAVTDPAAALAAETPAPLAPGLVEEVQILLTDLGYNPGGIDGVVGPATIEALEQFQRNQGLPVDGELSVDLLNQLQTIVTTAEAQEDVAEEEIIVASGAAGSEDETPLLDDEPEIAELPDVGRFEVVGVPLGIGLGTVRRMRPFDQRGTLITEGAITRASFGIADGDILRKLEVTFGPDHRAVSVELEQGNFAIDAIPELVRSLCEKYGDTKGCVESAADFECISDACKRGLLAHEMRWRDDDGRELTAAFFTGGSETVTQVILSLVNHGEIERLNELAAQEPVERPGADRLKL